MTHSNESKEILFRKLTGLQAVKALKSLLAEINLAGDKGLGAKDHAAFCTLIEFFGNCDEIPFEKVIKALWAENEPIQQAKNFSNFKLRSNKRFEKAGLKFRLQHQASNMAISKKSVWIEEGVSEAELYQIREKRDVEDNAREVANRIACELIRFAMFKFVILTLSDSVNVIYKWL